MKGIAMESTSVTLRVLQKRIGTLEAPGPKAIRQLPQSELRKRYSFADFEGLSEWRKGARLLGPLRKAAERLACTVEFGKPENPRAAAECDTAPRTILIRRFKNRRALQAHALAHELAHCVLRHGLDEPTPVVEWQVMSCLSEIEAEMVACLVCSKLGLDVLEVASRYVVYFWFKLDNKAAWTSERVWTSEREARVLAAAEEILQAVFLQQMTPEVKEAA